MKKEQLNKLSVCELKILAKSKAIGGLSKLKKSEMVSKIDKNLNKKIQIKKAPEKKIKIKKAVEKKIKIKKEVKPEKKIKIKKAVEKKIKIKKEVKPEKKIKIKKEVKSEKKIKIKKDKLKEEIKEAKQQVKVIKDDIGFFRDVKFKLPLKVSVSFNVLQQTQPDELNDNDRDMLKGIKKLKELNDERFKLGKIPSIYYGKLEKLISRNQHIGLGGVIPKSQDKIDELTDEIVEVKKKQLEAYIKYKDADERYKQQLKAVEDLKEKYRKKTPKFTVRKGKKKAVKTTNLDDLIKKAEPKKKVKISKNDKGQDKPLKEPINIKKPDIVNEIKKPIKEDKLIKFYEDTETVFKTSRRGFNDLIKKYNLSKDEIAIINMVRQVADFYPTPFNCVDLNEIKNNNLRTFYEGTSGLGNVVYYLRKLGHEGKIYSNELNKDLLGIQKRLLKNLKEIPVKNKSFEGDKLEVVYSNNDFLKLKKLPDGVRNLFLNPPFNLPNMKKSYYDFLFKGMILMSELEQRYRKNNKGSTHSIMPNIFFISPPLSDNEKMDSYISIEKLFNKMDKKTFLRCMSYIDFKGQVNNKELEKIHKLVRKDDNFNSYYDFNDANSVFQQYLDDYVMEIYKIHECKGFGGTSIQANVYRLGY